MNEQQENNEVECPLCGWTLDPRGLGSHENSYRCRTRQTIQEHELNGEISFQNETLKRGLDELGLDYERDIVNWTKGHYPFRYTSFQYGYWTKEENYSKVREEYLEGYKSFKTRNNKLRKVEETENFLVLKLWNSNDHLFFPFKKDQGGKTRKRVFKLRSPLEYKKKESIDRIEREGDHLDKILYDNDGERFGELVNTDELPEEVLEFIEYHSVRNTLGSS